MQALGLPECEARAPRLSDACEQLGELLAARFPGLAEFGLDLVDAIHHEAPDPLAGATVPDVDQRAVTARDRRLTGAAAAGRERAARMRAGG